jgi:hypothetical protein
VTFLPLQGLLNAIIYSDGYKVFSGCCCWCGPKVILESASSLKDRFFSNNSKESNILSTKDDPNSSNSQSECALSGRTQETPNIEEERGAAFCVEDDDLDDNDNTKKV